MIVATYNEDGTHLKKFPNLDAVLKDFQDYRELPSWDEFLKCYTLKTAFGNEDNRYMKGPYYHGTDIDFQFIVNDEPRELKIKTIKSVELV